MTREEIKKIVAGFMAEYDFEKNEHGVMIYSCGPSSFNVPIMFEELVRYAFEADGKIPHVHFASENDIDTCRVCGMDIRSKIHQA